MKIPSFVYIITGLMLLTGLFFFLKPQTITQSPNSKTQPTQEMAKPTTIPKHQEKVFVLTVKNGVLVSGEKALSVTQGDMVTIKITSDEAEEFHLHGYDESIELEKNKEAKLSFTADKTGRFPYELEYAKIDLGALEVHPN